MARLHDCDGNLLGGLGAAHTDLAAPPIMNYAAIDYLPPQPPARLPDYELGEIVIGLECNYGTFAYSHHASPLNNVSEHPQQPACHNPIETPDERHHCAACGGDYCEKHAAPAAHDCEHVISNR